MASESLQEIMRSIREDPRVLSLLSKKRGQTGVRDLQGESLRANLDALHGMLVCWFVVMKSRVRISVTMISVHAGMRRVIA